MTAEARREAYSLTTFTQGESPHYWDFAAWIAEMLENALENIEDLVGVEQAAGPLRQLVQPVAEVSDPEANPNDPSGPSWREVLDDVLAAGTVWPISERLQDALIYGLYGITPKNVPLPERHAWLARLVEDVTAFASRSDVIALGGGQNAIIKIAKLASSRHSIDTGRGEVDIHSMAIFGGITEGRVRNLLSEDGNLLERGPNGGVVAMSASVWLKKKKEFLPSIWQEEDDVDNEDDRMGSAKPVEAERMIFVPVSRDGSMFTPDLMRNGAFRIGEKGEEQDIESYEEALAALNSMPIPRWRRPNEKGIWGIVSGVAWQRVEKN